MKRERLTYCEPVLYPANIEVFYVYRHVRRGVDVDRIEWLQPDGTFKAGLLTDVRFNTREEAEAAIRKWDRGKKRKAARKR